MGLHLLVLAGGSGTRLWPLSRKNMPKHLLPIGTRGETLLEATVARLLPLQGQIHIVTSAAQQRDCAATLAAMVPPLPEGQQQFVVEPLARGTGPALSLAVEHIVRDDPAAVICSVHADHHIPDDSKYQEALLAAAAWAAGTDGFVAVGLKPVYASTGFGYIELGDQLPSSVLDAGWSRLGRPQGGAAPHLQGYVGRSFVEKPSLARAEQFLQAGTYLWNTGLFAWPGRRFLDELARVAPETSGSIRVTADAQLAGDAVAAQEAYGGIPAVAVEPLLFERTATLTAVAADFEWSDLGSWPDILLARQRASLGDDSGNVLEGAVTAIGCSDSLLLGNGGRHVVVIGAEHLVVVDTGDALLVVDAGSAQRVREATEELARSGRLDLL